MKRNAVVAVLGQRGLHGDGPCELWFLVASKESTTDEAFIEGFYLYDIEKKSKLNTHKHFELHEDDEPVQIAKVSVIDIVKDCECHNGIFSISKSVIAELEIIMSFEDDSNPSGQNRRVLSAESKPQSLAIEEAAIATAISSARSWKEKVRQYTRNLYIHTF